MLLPIHIAAGGLALILGAIALMARKGGVVHRRSGLIFVYAMLVMGMTAAILGNIGGGLLAVSQFTLLGDVRRGRRPSFADAMEPSAARSLFQHFCEECRSRGVAVEVGRFQAHMRVELVNDGPVTILVDTKRAF